MRRLDQIIQSLVGIGQSWEDHLKKHGNPGDMDDPDQGHWDLYDDTMKEHAHDALDVVSELVDLERETARWIALKGEGNHPVNS